MTHGTVSGYSHHKCRCAECRRAWNRHMKAYRARAFRGPTMVDATGTRRRLRALVALGWPSTYLKTRIGAAHIIFTDSAVVHPRTAARVRALYDELGGTLGPAPRSRTYAAAKGWPPPLAWDDDTIDDPAATPYVGPVPSRAARGREQLVEDFEHTRPAHRGLVTAAAMRLGMQPRSLARALHRAQAAGIDVRFTDDTKQLRRSA